MSDRPNAFRALFSPPMDTLVFAGLLVALLAVVGNKGRAVVLGWWWLILAATLALLAHHITSSLALSLHY